MTIDEDRATAIGEIKGRLGALEARFARHEDFVGENLREIRMSVDRISNQMSQGVGSSKAMLAVVGALGTLFGSIVSPVVARILHS